MAITLPTASDSYDGSNERAMRQQLERALGALQGQVQQILTSVGAISIGDTAVTLVNGANNNVATGYTGFAHIVGPTGVFNITGITGGEVGRILILSNTTAFAMTLTHQSASSLAQNRIISNTGADLALSTGSAILVYDAANIRWRCVAHT